MKRWVLVLTNSQDTTADFLVRKLGQSDVAYARLNTDAFVENVSLSATENEGSLCLEGKSFSPESFSHVWLRRPTRLGLRPGADPAATSHMEQEWFAGLEGWLARIPRERWINHPASNGAASYKVEQLWRAKRMGLQVPASLITQSRDEARRFYDTHRGAVVVKPLHGGYVSRPHPQADTVIYTHALNSAEISLFPAQGACPTLLQQRVAKKCDVRITILDETIHAVSLTAIDPSGEQRLDIRRDRMADVVSSPIKLEPSVETVLRRYVASYQLRFAAVDMAIDEADRWIFFELNPNGQWAWLDQSGASDIASSFIASFRR